MKHNIFSILTCIVSFVSYNVMGQTYSMSNTAVNTCSGTFYDSGGAGGSYANNQNFTMTFCSDTPGSEITFDFTSFVVENGWDYLYVYDGPSIASPQLTGSPFSGGNSPGMIQSTNGCLTFVFTSDGSVIQSGWAATISCAVPSCSDGIQNQGETGIDCGGPCPATCPPAPVPGGTDCSFLAPICTQVGLDFSANTGGVPASTVDPGNNYGCLWSSPNPAWYFLEVSTNGNIDMALSANFDIDFIIYGPFADTTAAQTGCGNYGNGGTGSAIVDCSYSGTSNETPSIPNAIAGEVYVMLITNYSNQVQQISLTQTGGTGGTDCSVLQPCNIDTGTDSTAVLCFEGPAVDLFTYLGGTPETGGNWFDPNGVSIVMPITPATSLSGSYEYTKDSAGCSSTSYVDVIINQVGGTSVVTNSDCMACNGDAQVFGNSGSAPYTYSIDGGANFQVSGYFSGLCGAVAPGVDYDIIVMDDLGCVDTVTVAVEDINFPSLISADSTNTSCYGVCDGTITLVGINVVNYSIDNNATIQPNGNFTGLCPGTYDIYMDNGSGCYVTDQISIIEPPVLEITSISPDIQLCPGAAAPATVTGVNGIGNVTYTWESGGNVIGTGSPTSVTFTGGTMVVCATMSDDCPSTDTECFTITEPQPVSAMMSSNITNGCDPLTVTLYNLTNTNLATTTWTLSNGTTIISSGSDSISVLLEDPGLYDVSMEVLTTLGCVYDTTYSNYIEVFANPNANFDYAPIPATIFDSEVSFQNFSSDDVVSWQWQFGSGVIPGSSSLENPDVIYPEGIPGDYPVTLTVQNGNGCIASVSATVVVANEVVVYAPNIFTPDGDEFNEGWRVYIAGIDIYDFHLTMFNRWGETVWESYNTEAVWTGHYGGGGFVQDGTYIWVIEAKDGYSDKKYEFRGHVTVLK